MKRLNIFIYLVISILCISQASQAQDHTSPNYALSDAYIVITAGSCSSANYSLDCVNIGALFTGTAQSANYSLSIRDASIIYDNPPQIQDIVVTSPANSHRDWPLTIKAQASDADGDSIEYKYIVNNVEVQDWTPQSQITWSHSSGNIGINDIKVEVRTPNDTCAEQQKQVYTYRKPITPE